MNISSRFAAAAAPAIPVPTALGPASLTRHVLPNGLVVLIYPNPTIPALVVRMGTKAGGIYNPADKAGLASLTAAAMRRGTRRHTFSDLNQITEERGLSVGMSAGYHMIEVGGRALREDAGFLLETIAEMVRDPVFPPDEIERLRSQVITGLLEQEDDTGAMANRIFRAALYPPDHPYSRDDDGDLESVRRITRQDMEKHYQAYLRPDTSILIIVGDVKPETALDLAAHALGDWQVAGSPPDFGIPDAPPPGGIQEVQHPIAGKTQNDLVLGFPCIRRANPDFYALQMANLILGRLGLYGRLGKSVREDQGLAYYASSGFEAGFGPGPWAVRAGVNPANVRRAVQSIVAEIARIRDEPISEAELAAGQRFLTGTLPLQLETSYGLAAQIQQIELFNLGWDFVQRYPQIIQSLTVADVQRAAQTYLYPDRYVLAIAGPELPPA